MKNKYAILTAALLLVLVGLACGVTVNLPEDAIEIGPVVTDEIVVAAPDSGDTAKVRLRFGSGLMEISPGAEGALIRGTASYNVEDLKTSVQTSGNQVEIESGSFDYDLTGLPNFNDIENTWDLKFGAYDTDLEIRAGAFKADLDLGGLALHNFRIFGGASSMDVNFSKPNRVAMNSMRITTGASTVKLHKLANANFSLLDFDGGAGTYVLDFSGNMQRDASVEVDVGLSILEIIVPEGVPAQVTVNGTLNNVNAYGDWKGDGSSFSQKGSGPALNITINTNAGTLTLDNN